MTNTINTQQLAQKRIQRAIAATQRLEQRLNSRNPSATERGMPTQTLPATPELRCPLSANKHCQKSQWCHDKVQLQQAYIRALRETPAAHAQHGNEQWPLSSAYAARLARAMSPSSREQRALRSRSRILPFYVHRPSLSRRASQAFLNLLPAPARLPWLELLQALARGRCFLLRTCVVPFYKLPLRINRTPVAGDRE